MDEEASVPIVELLDQCTDMLGLMVGEDKIGDAHWVLTTRRL
jgi:hypothetical protein